MLLVLQQELLLLGADLLGAAPLLLGRLVAGVQRGRRARLPGLARGGRRHLSVLQLHLLGSAALLLERHLRAVLQDDGVARLRLHRQSATCGVTRLSGRTYRPTLTPPTTLT